MEKNQDLKKHLGENRDFMMDHFIKFGMREGRKSSPNFILILIYLMFK